MHNADEEVHKLSSETLDDKAKNQKKKSKKGVREYVVPQRVKIFYN